MENGYFEPSLELALECMDKNPPQLQALLRKYAHYFPVIGIGTSRVVLDMDYCVLKIPLARYYFDYNEWEWGRYRNGTDGVRKRLAQCSLVWEDKVPLIIMEKVRPIKDNNNIPREEMSWVMDFDSLQVGWTLDGRLVAYDYPM